MLFSITLQQFLKIATAMTGVDLTPLGLIFVPLNAEVGLRSNAMSGAAFASESGVTYGIPLENLRVLRLLDENGTVEFVVGEDCIEMYGIPSSPKALQVMASFGLREQNIASDADDDFAEIERVLRRGRHGKRARQLELRRSGHSREDTTLRYRYAAPNTAA